MKSPDERPEQPVPEDVVLEKDAFSAEGLPPIRADAGQIGFIAGVKAGVLVGAAFVAIGVAAMANREYGAAEWLLIFAWLPGSGLLGGTIGWAAGQVVGPTQKELAGGMAGAVIGLFGGLFYSPLIGHIIEPMKDFNGYLSTPGAGTQFAIYWPADEIEKSKWRKAINDKRLAEPPSPSANKAGTPPLPLFVTGEIREIRISHGERYNRDFVPPVYFSKDETSALIDRASHVTGKKVIDLAGNGRNGELDGVTVVAQKATP